MHGRGGRGGGPDRGARGQSTPPLRAPPAPCAASRRSRTAPCRRAPCRAPPRACCPRCGPQPRSCPARPCRGSQAPCPAWMCVCVGGVCGQAGLGVPSAVSKGRAARGAPQEGRGTRAGCRRRHARGAAARAGALALGQALDGVRAHGAIVAAGGHHHLGLHHVGVHARLGVVVQGHQRPGGEGRRGKRVTMGGVAQAVSGGHGQHAAGAAARVRASRRAGQAACRAQRGRGAALPRAAGHGRARTSW